jgi:hypothetical protein
MADPDSPATVRLPPISIYLPAWQVHLLSGPPGGGKTTLVASWAQAWRTGQAIFGRETATLPWIGTLIADREKADTLQWYQTVGFPDIPHHSILDDFSIKTSRLRKPLEAFHILTEIVESMRIPPNGLLILDPIAPWCGGDLNRYHVVMPAMIDLGRLCLLNKITILGLAHTSKQKADSKDRYQRPQDRILGSTALLGCSGTQMALVPPEPDDPKGYHFTWVPHHAREETFRLERDDKTGLFIMGTIGAHARVPRPDVLVALPETGDGLAPAEIIVELATRHIFISKKHLFTLLSTWIGLGLVRFGAKRGLYVRNRPA